MKLNLLPIGLGNFGNSAVDRILNATNVKDQFKSGIAINASKQDIDLLSSKVTSYIIGDGNGTGKDRDLANEIMSSNLQITNDVSFKEMVEKADIVTVYAASGGGFGSGSMNPFIQELIKKNPNKKVICCTTLPSDKESYLSQLNSLQFTNELYELGIPYMIYDNGKFDDLTPDEMSASIMENIISDLCVLRGDYVGKCLIGGIDQRDLLTSIQPGRLVISSIHDVSTFDTLLSESKSIVELLKYTINNNSGHAILDENSKTISSTALMFELHSQYIDYVTEGRIKNEIQIEFGKTIVDFRNECTLDDSDDTLDNIHLILSGLNLPETRIKKMIDAKSTSEKIITQAQNKPSSLNLGNNLSSKLKLSRNSTFGKPTETKQNNSLIGNKIEELKNKK